MSVVPDSASSARSRDALLTTKLYAPRARPGLVPRPHLTERLEEGLTQRLTLVSAPAGFGKTTLVGEWLRRGERPFAWLSLDESDDDPTRFLAYLVAALQSIDPTWGQAVQRALQSPQPPPPTAVLTALVNEVAVSRVDFVLVLDDYHLISAPPVHEALAFLLDNMPPPLHLVILTRADPPFSLSRLRARGELTEVRTDELRFTAQESATFLNQVAGLDLASDQIRALESRTEGWVAGLQLAALSLHGLQRDDEVAAFIAAFAGSHRYVMDYLIEEVFNRQPPDVQAFLLQTSILDRLCGPLCDALVGGSDGSTVLATGGQQMLERLERANLFTQPLDHHRGWYRYHQLFADLLRDRLRQTQPERIPALHQRASAWYVAQGLADQAFRHAMAAGDLARAAGVVEKSASPMIWRGEVTAVLNWLNALPGELVRSRPRLGVAYAWVLFLSDRVSAIEPRLQDAERALAHLENSALTPDETHEIPALRDEVALIRLLVTPREEDSVQAIELSRRALEGISEDNLFARGLLQLNLGFAFRRGGYIDQAIQAVTAAVRLSRAAGNTVTAMLGTFGLVRLYRIQGQLRQAAGICHQVLQSATAWVGPEAQRVPALAAAYLGLAEVSYARNELEEAERCLQECIALGEPGGYPDFLVTGYAMLARVRQARGDFQGALDALAEAEQAAQRTNLPQSILDVLAAYRARTWLVQGNLEAVARWVQDAEFGSDDPYSLFSEYKSGTLVRLLLAQGRPAEAEPVLEPLLSASESEGRIGKLIELLGLQALVRGARGDARGALGALKRALELAEPEGYVRPFVDEGTPMAALLRQALSRGIMPDYAAQLLAACRPSAVAHPLVEPLTPRELEVLRLIVAGLRNQEIAAQLVISVATVKRHITNIYGKLGVSHRTQAVSRARELNLL
jgi:LuxR family maltose regulon positive regulatory protein